MRKEMSKSNEELKKIEMLIKQEYNEIPNHKMIGKTLRMKEGDARFFYPGTKKVIQMVKRGSVDGKLYYVVYGDGKYRYELFLVPAEDFY